MDTPRSNSAYVVSNLLKTHFQEQTVIGMKFLFSWSPHNMNHKLLLVITIYN